MIKDLKHKYYLFLRIYIYSTYLFSWPETWSGMTAFVFPYAAYLLIAGFLECSTLLLNVFDKSRNCSPLETSRKFHHNNNIPKFPLPFWQTILYDFLDFFFGGVQTKITPITVFCI